MPVLDFTTLTNTDLQAYFHEGSLKHDAGYDDYEGEFEHIRGFESVENNQTISETELYFTRKLREFFTNENLTGAIDVLELGIARGQGDAMDTAMTFSADFTDAAGTADQLQIVTSGSFTPAGTPADNDHMFFEIMRQGSDAADTFDSTARLHSATVHFTTDAATAA